MVDDTKPTVLVTGASSGIGEELARQAAKDKCDLLLVARNADRLKSVAEMLASKYKVSVDTLALDVTVADALAELDAVLEAQGRHVAVLINNAGLGDIGPFAEADANRLNDMVDLNVSALTALSRHFLPGMLARDTGGILNVASTASFLPGPNMAVYYATKAYVLSLSDAMAYELKGTGVTVSALCPGPTATGFQAAAHMEGARLLKFSAVMSPGRVARIGWRAFKRGRRVKIAGLINLVQSRLMPFTPRSLKLGLVSFLQS
ncbi:MAG: SDR family oxidoreductase [Rhodobiaceae bacterium]|nr:SDR family oxidoreductase [Rhodobiaceae bacterium]